MIKLARAIKIVLQSVRVSFPIFTATATINATAATFTASKNAPKVLDFLSLGNKGFKIKTNKNEGRKIPMVAAIAPEIPFICHPIKVAVDNTGPGVICPTATASINTCLVSQPFATNSESRKAKRTYPLPYKTAPTFKKVRNIFKLPIFIGSVA